MILSDKELAKIPIAPRAKGFVRNKPVKFRAAKDPTIMAIARMVVAGIDKKHSIHPHYDALVKRYGLDKAKELIESAVSIPGVCDDIQTDMCYGGVGLFGGLSENGSRFIFYEWSGDNSAGQLKVSMTRQEARDIVSGKKKTIVFKPEKFLIRLCIDPFKHLEYSFQEYLKRAQRSIRNERIYVKNAVAWKLPRYNYENGEEYPDPFVVKISGKQFNLNVEGVHFPHPDEDKNRRINIQLSTEEEMRAEIRQALYWDKSWKLKGRHKIGIL